MTRRDDMIRDIHGWLRGWMPPIDNASVLARKIADSLIKHEAPVVNAHEAVGRIAHFVDEWEKMIGHDPDIIYGLHRGADDREAVLTATDLRAVVAEVTRLSDLLIRLSTAAVELADAGEDLLDSRPKR